MTAPTSDLAVRVASARQSKLKALVAAHWGEGDNRETHALAGGAALTEGGTGRAWVLIDDRDPKRFGVALVWAARRDVGGLDPARLDVLVETAGQDEVAGIIARRAERLARPPGVWSVRGRELVATTPAPSEPAASAPAGALALVDVLAGHGVDPVIEHGAVAGEILGLEVARVVADGAGGWRIDVGVGRHDREARAEMRAGQDPLEALDEVVADVRARRTSTAGSHPANTLARERWLRAVVMARPGLVGASWLAPVASAMARHDLRVAVPAPAVGVGEDSRPLVAVCSVGVDLDLVPTAADIRARDDPDAELVLVVPAGDDYPVTHELAAALAAPARVITLPWDWPTLG